MAYTKPSDKGHGSPSGEAGDNVKIGELADESALVVLNFLGIKHDIQTVNGVADAANVDLTIVTGQHAGRHEADRLIFNVGVTNVLQNVDEGDVVLGRIEWRNTKSGRQAACLMDPREGDEALADKALAVPF